MVPESATAYTIKGTECFSELIRHRWTSEIEKGIHWLRLKQRVLPFPAIDTGLFGDLAVSFLFSDFLEGQVDFLVLASCLILRISDSFCLGLLGLVGEFRPPMDLF